MEKIVVAVKLSQADFIKVNFHLAYRKWAFKFATGLGVFMLLIFVFLLLAQQLNEIPWFQLFLGLYFTVGFPIHIYFAAKRNFKTNPRATEQIVYQFEPQTIQIAGESFNSELTWDRIYSVTENKDWILIWQNAQVANVVPKRDFKAGELNFFKMIVGNQKGIKNKLK